MENLKIEFPKEKTFQEVLDNNPSWNVNSHNLPNNMFAQEKENVEVFNYEGFSKDMAMQETKSKALIFYEKIESFINDLNSIIDEYEINHKKRIGRFKFGQCSNVYKANDPTITLHTLLDFDGFIDGKPKRISIVRFKKEILNTNEEIKVKSELRVLEEVYRTILLHLTMAKEVEFERNGIKIKIKPLYKYMQEGLT